ncbi:hypothetical protein HaLaN_09881, partial [Haematococcus lacustris]
MHMHILQITRQATVTASASHRLNYSGRSTYPSASTNPRLTLTYARASAGALVTRCEERALPFHHQLIARTRH